MFEKRAYAYKISGKRKRLDSQSGGAFAVIAEIWLNNGGIVYGVAFEKPYAVYKRINTVKGLEAIKGSKYVQALLENTITSIEKDLNNGEKVLFSGTPCYVAAVNSYCKYKKLNITNLLTVEFLCHGVPSPQLFKAYIEHVEKNNNCEINNVKFRDKRVNGWGGYYSTYLTNNDVKTSENWLDIFHSDRYFRESCFNCIYTSKERYADITISDFWAVGQVLKTFGDSNGISMILFNSQKGFMLKPQVESKGIMSEVELNDIVQRPMEHPTIKRDDGVSIDWSKKSFSENAYEIFKHYSKKDIKIKYRIPMTGNISFQKEYWISKIKGSFLLICMRNIFIKMKSGFRNG